MPNFPTSPNPPLPEVLNPLNPRHYWLLLTWIFFQPSRLKHYLYRADPELYQAKGWKALRWTLHRPAYLSLYLMSSVLTVLLSVFLSVGVAWVAAVALGAEVDWARLASDVAQYVAIGMAFGLVVGVVYGVTNTNGAASSMWVGATFGLWFSVMFSLISVGNSVAVHLATDVAFGVWFGLVFGTANGMAGGVAFGIAFGVAGGVWVGTAVGVAADVMMGVLLGVGYGGGGSEVFGTAVGTAFGTAIGVGFGVAGSLACGMSGSRFILHVFEWPLAWWLSRFPRSSGDPFLRLESHPAVWDELAVWPLPGVERLLLACLSTDFDRGLHLAVRVACNPFQRWAVQCALSDFVAYQADSLSVLYKLAHHPLLDEYLLILITKRDFDNWPSARIVLLGEIGRAFVDSTGGRSETEERLVWQITRGLRRMEANPLSGFSFMLCELINVETMLESQNLQEFNLTERFPSTSEGVRRFKHGDEVASSFAAIYFFLRFHTVGGIAGAYQQLDWVKSLAEPFLRPAVIDAVKALGDVSKEAAAFKRATSTVQKSAALNRAAGALNELAGYIQKEVKPPERVLLKRVVGLWQSIIAAEQGKLGEATLREMDPAARRVMGTAIERASAIWQRPLTAFDNPYVVGNPVYPPLFVGRKDIFNRIGEVWSAKSVPDSIILYGHRRMGKSSILRNLKQATPPGSVVVYVDMAGETSFVQSTADLLLALADAIYTAVRDDSPQAATPQPDYTMYASPFQAQIQFSRFSESVRTVLAGRTLILALDEFEAVERAVEQGKIGKEIYQFLRAKTQESWITLVLGGLHTLDEMSRDYRQPFYGSYENIRVSYLAHEDAWRLITNPVEDFALNYEREAVERLIAETGGQPYLVQQVCRDALDHLNHELFDAHRERDVVIALADVEAVLGLDFFQRGTVYFDGVWNQTDNPDHRTLLRALATRPEPWTLPELEAATRFSSDALSEALRWAERHDILRESESAVWEYHVPLMRRWVSERTPG